MLNYQLSVILSNLAEVSKQKDDSNKEIVIEYTRAARTIRDLSEDIREVYFEGRAQELPGITPGIFSIIKEYFESGKIGIYEELKKKYSEDLLRFIRISGLGRRRIFTIYDIMKINTLEELKNSISDGSIYKKVLDNDVYEKDFIVGSHIDRLKKSMDYFERTSGLYPKGYVDFFIDKVISQINGINGIKKLQITGSVRRCKPFIKDIDVLILPDFNLRNYDSARSEELLKKIGNTGVIKELLSFDRRPGNISASFDTVYDIDVEVIVSSAENWTVDLLYSTGSKKHIEKLENIAKSSGKFKDGRIFFNDLPGKPIPENEEIIYKKLDLQYIPPELREDRGEVELASKNALPRLVEFADIKGDLHIHSYWSDGMMEIEDIIRKARSLNYSYIAISDHSFSNYYGNGLDKERMIKKIEEMNQLKKRSNGLKLLIGGEVDIKGAGILDYDAQILEKMDIILGSMHSNYLNTRDENTARIVSTLENKYVDAIAHPTGVVFGARAPYDLDMDRIFEAAVKNNKAMEINSYLLRLDLNDEIAGNLKKAGGKIVINTDSHRISNLDMIKLGIEVARRAGLAREDVLNAMEYEDFCEWKKNR